MAGQGAAAAGLEVMPSMRCVLCNIYVRSFQGVGAHSIRTSHRDQWAYTNIALRHLVCAECDQACGSERVADLHTKSSGHLEFIIRTATQKKPKLAELMPPEIDGEVLKKLIEMGYTEARATRALYYVGTKEIEDLTQWIADNEDDPDIDKPLLVRATDKSDKWSNMVTDEMKLRSHELRMEARNRAAANGAHVMEDPVLPTERTLEFFVDLSKDTMTSLKKEFVIAEDLDDDDLSEKIKVSLKDCDPGKGVFSFQLPSRGNDKSYEYNTSLKQICLKKGKTYTCSTDSKKHAKKALRIGTLLMLVQELIEKQEAIRLRWVYYLNPKIYSNQDASDEAIAAASLMLEATRTSFHIRASPRGSILGPIFLCSQGKIIVNCTLGGSSGSKIPSEAEEIDQIIQISRVDFILILEKETVFHRLSDIDFYRRFNCIIVTASGEPDVATRVVLKKLRMWLDVPIYALVDANPQGFDILCTYRFGSKNRAYDNLSLTIPDLVWIGVFDYDIKEDDDVEKLKPKDLKKLETAKGKEHIRAVAAWRYGLSGLIEGGKRADIETVMKNCKLDDYIMERVRESMILKS